MSGPGKITGYTDHEVRNVRDALEQLSFQAVIKYLFNLLSKESFFLEKFRTLYLLVFNSII